MIYMKLLATLGKILVKGIPIAMVTLEVVETLQAKKISKRMAFRLFNLLTELGWKFLKKK